jgi:hypothetical protein
MTEAWFLFDEPAIRRAAGCPNGDMDLRLPPLKSVESMPDPKALLLETLRTASNLSGRRLKKFEPDRLRLANLIDDFSPLRALQAFCAVEEHLRSALLGLGLLRTDSQPPPSAP